jgi:hypothetical protein
VLRKPVLRRCRHDPVGRSVDRFVTPVASTLEFQISFNPFKLVWPSADDDVVVHRKQRIEIFGQLAYIKRQLTERLRDDPNP